MVVLFLPRTVTKTLIKFIIVQNGTLVLGGTRIVIIQISMASTITKIQRPMERELHTWLGKGKHTVWKESKWNFPELDFNILKAPWNFLVDFSWWFIQHATRWGLNSTSPTARNICPCSVVPHSLVSGNCNASNHTTLYFDNEHF